MPAVANIAVTLTPEGVSLFQDYPYLVGATRDYYAGELGAYNNMDALPDMAWLEAKTAGYFGDSYGTAESITYEPGAEPGMSLQLGTLTLIGLPEAEPPGPPTTVSITVRYDSPAYGAPEHLEPHVRAAIDRELAQRAPSSGLPDAMWFQGVIRDATNGVFYVTSVEYAPGSVDGMSPTLDDIIWVSPNTSPVPVNIVYRFTEPARDTPESRASVQATLESALSGYTNPSAPPGRFYQEALDEAQLWWAEIASVTPAETGTYGRPFVLGTLELAPPDGPVLADQETSAYGYVLFAGPWLKSQLPHGWDTFSESHPRGLWDADGIDVRAPDGSRLVFRATGSATRGDGYPPTAMRSNGAAVPIEVRAKFNGAEMPHRMQLNDPVFPLPNFVNVLGQHNYSLWVPDLAFCVMHRERPGHWPNRPAMGTELTFSVPQAVQQRYPNIPPIDPACRIYVFGGDYTQSPYYFIRTYTQSEQEAGFKNVVGIDYDVLQRRWRDGTVTSLPDDTPKPGWYALPSVQLEEVTTSWYEYEGLARVVNRVPEDGEVEVPHWTRGSRTPIVFQVLRHWNFKPSLSSLSVRVDGELVYDGGTFQNGWTGTADVLGEYDGIRMSMSRAQPFESAHRTEVVVSHNGSLSASWRFTWKDESPPYVEDAAPEGLFIVKVTFNEPVDPDSAYVPSHYRLRRVSAVAAEPRPIAAIPGASEREVWVAFDQPLTFGAVYTLEATGVADRFGNVMTYDPQGEARTFVATRPEVPDGRRFVLWDFIPDLYKRIDQDSGDLAKFIAVLQEPTDLLLHEIDRFAQLPDPDVAPEDFVGAMLADLGCPFDVSELELGEKRKLLSLLISIYQQKGTTEGLIDAARALLGLEIDVHPLNEGGWMLGVHELGNWETTWLGPETSFQRFAFEVTIFTEIGREPTDLQRARLIELIHVMRPAHTHFRRLNEMPTGYYPEA